MVQIGKREFLQHASRYLKTIEENGEELVITHHNQPRLKLVPVKARTLRSLKGTLKKCLIKGDINAPVLPGYHTW